MPSETGLQSSGDTPGGRAWLSARTENVVNTAYRTAYNTVRIGVILCEVRDTIGRGRYEAWVKAELPFSVPTAMRYRQVAAAFGQFLSIHFERFDPSALYVLAQLATPPAAREHAVTMVEFGQRITRADALDIIDAHKPVPDDATPAPAAPAGEVKLLRCLGEVTNKKTKEKVRCPVEFLTTPGLRFCPKCSAAANGPAFARPASDALLAKRWRTFEELVTGCSEVRISPASDGNGYSVTCHRPDDRPHSEFRRELYDALAVLAGKKETRFCSGHKPLYPDGHDEPVGGFGRNALNPGGLMYRCRECEKARRAQMRREKRLAKQAGRSGDGGRRAA